MGFLAKMLKLVLKIAKPFLKQAIIESIMEIIGEEASNYSPVESSTDEYFPDVEFTTLPDVDISVDF